VTGTWRLLTSCVLLSTMALSADQGESLELVVMTYNVGSAARVPLGPSQMEQVARQMVDAGADVVGMTELDIGTDWHDGRDMVAEIAVRLAGLAYPMHRYYSPTLRYHGGCMVEVIWSRYPVVDSGYTVIHREVHEDWKCVRVCIEPRPGLRLHLFQTHYWIGDFGCHEEQTNAILDYAAQYGGPQIIMGDLNFTPGKPYYKMYQARGYREAAAQVRGEPMPTAGRGPHESRIQIDYIWGRGVEFLDAWVPDDTVSDHWPIAARVRIPPRAGEPGGE